MHASAVKKTAVGVCFFFTVLTCSFTLSTVAYANGADSPVGGEVATLQEGDLAPFAGTLFSTLAAGELVVRLNDQQKQCDLEKNKAVDLLKAELQLKINLKQAEIDSLNYKHTQLNSIHKDQIKFLQSYIKPPSWYESGEFWFAMGAVVGVAVAVASGYVMIQGSR